MSEQKKTNLAPNKVENIAGLVSYVTDSVVSRTLLKNSGGTVTIFAFSQGQGLSKHSASFDALVQILDGKMTITIEEEDHIVNKGELLLMPADIPHALIAEEDTRMLLVMLKGE